MGHAEWTEIKQRVLGHQQQIAEVIAANQLARDLAGKANARYEQTLRHAAEELPRIRAELRRHGFLR
jgi:hypothetical protein